MLFCIVSLFARDYKVGFAQDTLANDWRVAQVEEVKKEIEKHPNLSLLVKDAKASISNQIADIEHFIENNYDFIITSPINAQITSMVLHKAIEKNIKVILIDRGIDSKDYTTFIRPDNKKIAKNAAEYMAKKMNYKGTILMLEGIKNASVTTYRTDGFMEIIKKYPKMKVIKYTANFLRADAIKVMEKVYSENIHFDAIYSQSDSMLSGVRTLMEEKGKDTSILMVGIDYIKESKKAILEGKQTISFPYLTCGKEGVQAIVDIINHKDVKKDLIISSKIVDKNNAKFINPIF